MRVELVVGVESFTRVELLMRVELVVGVESSTQATPSLAFVTDSPTPVDDKPATPITNEPSTQPAGKNLSLIP